MNNRPTVTGSVSELIRAAERENASAEALMLLSELGDYLQAHKNESVKEYEAQILAGYTTLVDTNVLPPSGAITHAYLIGYLSGRKSALGEV